MFKIWGSPVFFFNKLHFSKCLMCPCYSSHFATASKCVLYATPCCPKTDNHGHAASLPNAVLYVQSCGSFCKELGFWHVYKGLHREGLSFEEITLQKEFKSILIHRFFFYNLCSHVKIVVLTVFPRAVNWKTDGNLILIISRKAKSSSFINRCSTSDLTGVETMVQWISLRSKIWIY